MKKISLYSIILSLFFLSSCITTHSFYYDYNELKQNVEKVEIIYMENEVTIFYIHSYVDINDTDYEIIKVLSSEEIDRLIKSLTKIEFTYNMLWIPASVSGIIKIQGYGIKLYFRSNNDILNADDQFIILAQTGEYRHGMTRLDMNRTGRKINENDWNNLISEFYSE